MAQSKKEPAVNERVRDYRKRMRQQGMRPIQLWIADVRAPGFAEEAHRQSAVVAASSHAQNDQTFVDALSLDGE